jgi:hypothetical protein
MSISSPYAVALNYLGSLHYPRGALPKLRQRIIINHIAHISRSILKIMKKAACYNKLFASTTRVTPHNIKINNLYLKMVGMIHCGCCNLN